FPWRNDVERGARERRALPLWSPEGPGFFWFPHQREKGAHERSPRRGARPERAPPRACGVDPRRSPDSALQWTDHRARCFLPQAVIGYSARQRKRGKLASSRTGRARARSRAGRGKWSPASSLVRTVHGTRSTALVFSFAESKETSLDVRSPPRGSA